MLKGKKIVIGITGSIAAYKIPFLVRLLVKEGATVQVVMSPAATAFITPLTLSTLSCRPVLVDAFEQTSGEWNSHVEIGLWADLMLFAPVTANTLGKMVNGIADNLVITAYLSARCPVLIAPAMDMDMYQHPSTQKNLEILKSFGNQIIEPQIGELASGLFGPGRMEDPSVILDFLKSFFKKKDRLKDKTVLVTAGPTHEPIDPIRFIGNHSSGKMGYAIANEAALQGANVILISGPSSLSADNSAVTIIRVETAEEMYEACTKYFPSADITIMSAAVADFKPLIRKDSKIKKSAENITIVLEPTKDILAELGLRKREDQILAGFALETENGRTNASSKLQKKNLDLIVLNVLSDEGAGFNNDTNKVTFIDKTGQVTEGLLKSKKEVAEDLLDVLFTLSKSLKNYVI